MNNREGVLAIDVGTSKVHANIVDTENGALIKGHIARIPWIHPQRGWTEIDPESLWQAVEQSVNGVMLDNESEIIAVSCSFQGDAFFLAGKHNAPLYNFIVAMDRRGLPYVDEIKEGFGAEKFQSILGCKIGPWEPCKYLHMARNYPELLAQTQHITSVQEYVMSKLGLGYCQDYTCASRKLMWDVQEDGWSKELCDYIGLETGLLDSPVHASHDIVGYVKSIGSVEFARELPVIVGAHDAVAGMLGVGVVPGGSKIVANVAGTTDHLGMIANQYMDMGDHPAVIYRGPFKGTYIIMGANSVGASIQWGVQNLFPERGDFSCTICELFESILFDARSSVVHTGKGMQAAHGNFWNINLETQREDIFKSLVEGVTYPLQSVYKFLEQINHKPYDVVRIGNGGAKSQSWVQFKADLFNRPMETVMNNEISSVGAALLACLALKKYVSIEEAQERLIHVKDRIEPDSKTGDKYKERIAEWRTLVERDDGFVAKPQ